MSVGQHLPHIAITAGEPAGIGPDLCVMLAQHPLPAAISIIADFDLIADRAKTLGIPIKRSLELSEHWGDGHLHVLHQAIAHSSVPGTLNPANSSYVLACLDTAIEGCVQGVFDAMVTAPLHKGVINDAGIPFTGHTEYLADRIHTPRVVMMLVGGGLRVALATTHIPLEAVSDHITQDGLETTLRILHTELIHQFGIARPRILVAGLNPHAGEGGHLGMQEIQVITPVLDKLRATGMQLIGPLPADTLFTPRHLDNADAVLAMFHDQGLPVLKYASFGEGVNITLGLPFIRTSVDHGTALDLAGTGKASIGSLLAAIQLAIELCHKKNHRAPT